mgnify:CR=1 FL=1
MAKLRRRVLRPAQPTIVADAHQLARLQKKRAQIARARQAGSLDVEIEASLQGDGQASDKDRPARTRNRATGRCPIPAVARLALASR